MPRSPATYLRFVVGHIDPDAAVRSGPFWVAGQLRDDGTLSFYDQEHLTELLDWFNSNLEKPERFNRTNSKGYADRAARGISWLKAEAHEHIGKMRELAGLLAEHGYFVDQIETDRPGYIVYEDDHQIVAEPFTDTPTAP
jgi:hypothetical protein